MGCSGEMGSVSRAKAEIVQKKLRAPREACEYLCISLEKHRNGEKKLSNERTHFYASEVRQANSQHSAVINELMPLVFEIYLPPRKSASHQQYLEAKKSGKLDLGIDPNEDHGPRQFIEV